MHELSYLSGNKGNIVFVSIVNLYIYEFNKSPMLKTEWKPISMKFPMVPWWFPTRVSESVSSWHPGCKAQNILRGTNLVDRTRNAFFDTKVPIAEADVPLSEAQVPFCCETQFTHFFVPKF